MSKQVIHFHYLEKGFYFQNRRLLKEYILKSIRKEGKQVEIINYIFCSDNYLIKLNQSYLNHNTYTDIITFELSEKNQPLIAEIYISIDRIKDNSKNFNASFKNELLRVVFHGALHLCGYKDKMKKDIVEMRSKEQEWIHEYSQVSRETL